MRGGQFFQVAVESMSSDDADLSELLSTLKQQLNIKGKQLFLPIRIALTGEAHGPELKLIFQLQGVERVKSRLRQALEICG